MKLHKIRTILFRYFPKTYFRIYFLYKKKQILHINNPVNMTDLVIKGIIYNSNNKLRISCTDKLRVREYLKEKGLNDILVPLIKTYNNQNEIDLTILPEKFVLKANHGSKLNLIINKNENPNLNKIKAIAGSWISEPLNPYFDFEPHYKLIKPKLFCEEYIDDFSATIFPIDYKIYCYYGEPQFINAVIRYIEDGREKFKLNAYDLNWKPLNYITRKHQSGVILERPINLQLMVEYSRKLASEFDFVRVDLYNVNGKIYFGELTFTPGGGNSVGFTKEMIRMPVKSLGTF